MMSMMMKGKKKMKKPMPDEKSPEEAEGSADPKSKKKPVGGGKMDMMRASGCKKGGK